MENNRDQNLSGSVFHPTALDGFTATVKTDMADHQNPVTYEGEVEKVMRKPMELQAEIEALQKKASQKEKELMEFEKAESQLKETTLALQNPQVG